MDFLTANSRFAVQNDGTYLPLITRETCYLFWNNFRIRAFYARQKVSHVQKSFDVKVFVTLCKIFNVKINLICTIMKTTSSSDVRLVTSLYLPWHNKKFPTFFSYNFPFPTASTAKFQKLPKKKNFKKNVQYEDSSIVFKKSSVMLSNRVII